MFTRHAETGAAAVTTSGAVAAAVVGTGMGPADPGGQSSASGRHASTETGAPSFVRPSQGMTTISWSMSSGV